MLASDDEEQAVVEREEHDLEREPERDDLPRAEEARQWRAEFEAAARRPLEQRFRYAFIRTYKPVLDDEPFRSFGTTAEYRAWCEENLPSWLGYGHAV